MQYFEKKMKKVVRRNFIRRSSRSELSVQIPPSSLSLHAGHSTELLGCAKSLLSRLPRLPRLCEVRGVLRWLGAVLTTPDTNAVTTSLAFRERRERLLDPSEKSRRRRSAWRTCSRSVAWHFIWSSAAPRSFMGSGASTALASSTSTAYFGFRPGV